MHLLTDPDLGGAVFTVVRAHRDGTARVKLYGIIGGVAQIEDLMHPAL